MNNINTEHVHTDSTSAQMPRERSLKFWIRAADRFMSKSLAETLMANGMSRRDWRKSPAAEEFLARVNGAVPAEDMATTLRTLEAIAREFGWDEEAPMPKRRGRGFGHGLGDGHEHGQGYGRGRSHGHGHGRAMRMAQQTYERGFDAGFSRGREI